MNRDSVMEDARHNTPASGDDDCTQRRDEGKSARVRVRKVSRGNSGINRNGKGIEEDKVILDRIESREGNEGRTKNKKDTESEGSSGHQSPKEHSDGRIKGEARRKGTDNHKISSKSGGETLWYGTGNERLQDREHNLMHGIREDNDNKIRVHWEKDKLR